MFFCSCNVQGFNTKDKKDINYPNYIQSTFKTHTHGPTLPVPLHSVNLDTISTSESIDIDSNNTDYYEKSCNALELLAKSKLNDLIKDLDLPKDTSELLASGLRNKNLLVTLSYFYRNCEHKYV